MAIGIIGIGTISTFATFHKDLGRKYCAVTKMDAMFIPSVLQRI